MTPNEDDRPIGPADAEQTRMRAHSAADLSEVRRAIRGFLGDRNVPDDVVGDVLIAVSELTTNALQAASGAWPTEVCIELRADLSGNRSIVATIDNAGDPYPGTLHVSPHLTAPPERKGGRGLILAARLGRVRLEGRIGGSRAVFERAI